MPHFVPQDIVHGECQINTHRHSSESWNPSAHKTFTDIVDSRFHGNDTRIWIRLLGIVKHVVANSDNATVFSLSVRVIRLKFSKSCPISQASAILLALLYGIVKVLDARARELPWTLHSAQSDRPNSKAFSGGGFKIRSVCPYVPPACLPS